MSTTTSTTEATQATSSDSRGVVAPLLFGFFPNQVLHVAATLALPDRLLDGPRTADDLAAETGTHGPSLYRVLRALACFGILAETGPGTFALGPHGRSLLTDDPASLRHLVLLFSGDGVWRSWGELGETVRTGEPAWDRVTGMSAFEHMAAHPDEQEMFNRAMSEATRNAVPGIIEVGGFDRFHHVVDVGGGDGTLLAAVLDAHPGLAGTLFDTPDGLREAPDHLARVAGDFFTSVPEGADCYLTKSVIHDWDDDRAATILASIRRVIPDGGRLLVVEPVMPASPAGSADVLMMVMSDLNMLVCTGGKERTEAEFRELFAAGGFSLDRIAPATGPTNFSVLEGVPA
jgi:hypothetical protein